MGFYKDGKWVDGWQVEGLGYGNAPYKPPTLSPEDKRKKQWYIVVIYKEPIPGGDKEFTEFLSWYTIDELEFGSTNTESPILNNWYKTCETCDLLNSESEGRIFNGGKVEFRIRRKNET